MCWNRSSNASSALVCIPWAGAGAAPFRQWAPVVGHHARLYSARLAGREARIRESPATDLDTVVAELVEAIRELPDDPVHLFGHCSGAIIAFEVARALRHEPAPALGRLIVAGQVAPRRFVESGRSADDAQRYLPEELRGNDEFARLMLPILEADLRAFARYTYVPGEPLDVPVTAIRGGRDPYVSDDDLAAWSEETTGSFTGDRVDRADAMFSGEAWGWLADEVLRAVR